MLKYFYSNMPVQPDMRSNVGLGIQSLWTEIARKLVRLHLVRLHDMRSQLRLRNFLH